MIGALMQHAEADLFIFRPVVVLAFDVNTGAYTVQYQGATIGPVWSLNGVRHSVGATVRGVMKTGLIVAIAP